METAPLNEALTAFAATAPEFGPHGLANHGPMAAEALEHLGRAAAIARMAAITTETMNSGTLYRMVSGMLIAAMPM